MGMVGRKYAVIVNGYRYKYNGKETVIELNDQTDSYDFGARVLDTRIGRWFSVDREVKPSFSGYTGMGNSPIITIDPDGQNEIVIVDKNTKTIAIYSPILYNASKDNLLSSVANATPADIEAAVQKSWEKPENQKVMIDVGGGRLEAYTMVFKVDLIVTKDDKEFNKIDKEFSDNKINRSQLHNVNNISGASYYTEAGRVGHMEINVSPSKSDQISTFDKTVSNFSHEGISHASGLSHSQIPTTEEINPINHIKYLKNDDAKAGISSYNNIRSPQLWEVQAIANSIAKVAFGKSAENSSSPQVYNLYSNGSSSIRTDAVNSLEPIKSKNAKAFVDKKIAARDARVKP